MSATAGTSCCSQPLRFDPTARGTTVGGLALIAKEQA